MQSCAVQVGQTVTAGQVIGYVGSTGYTTGNACPTCTAQDLSLIHISSSAPRELPQRFAVGVLFFSKRKDVTMQNLIFSLNATRCV